MVHPRGVYYLGGGTSFWGGGDSLGGGLTPSLPWGGDPVATEAGPRSGGGLVQDGGDGSHLRSPARHAGHGLGTSGNPTAAGNVIPSPGDGRDGIRALTPTLTLTLTHLQSWGGGRIMRSGQLKKNMISLVEGTAGMVQRPVKLQGWGEIFSIRPARL